MKTPAWRLFKRALSSSAARYLVVGGFAFLIDVGLLALFHELLGSPLVIATPTAFLISFAATYLMQRLLTFGAKGAWFASALRYAALVLFNAVATTAIVAGTEQVGLPWVYGKVVAVALTTVWNYFGYRYWIFRRPT